MQVSEIDQYLKDTSSTSLVNSAKKRKELFEMCLASAGFMVHDKMRLNGVHRRKVAVGVKFTSDKDGYCDVDDSEA